MARARYHGQMGPVIVTQRGCPLQLSPQMAAGSSSPSPCRVVGILQGDHFQDEREDWSNRFGCRIRRLPHSA